MFNKRGIILDLFAGGGGASVGIANALQGDNAYVDVAVNHDEAAIIMHQANHPQTEHYLQSVFDIDPRKVVDGSFKTDENVDNSFIELLWASPDCTHFSKALSNKKRKDSKIRGLAWSIIKFAALPASQRPRVILMENVEGFVTWGPLDEEGKLVEYGFSMLDELEHAYAITIHKSQGSEYPAVVMPILTGPKILFNRNLLYTAVTRAKKCVTVVGSSQMIQSMIANENQVKRCSSLHIRIKELE